MFLTRFVLVVGVSAFGLLVLSPSPVMAADAKVTGIISVKGKPLAAGKVIFYLDNGQFVGSKVKNGKYTIDRVPVGARKVTVEGAGVPAKYASEDTSDLAVEVPKGTFNYNIELQ
jgi:hypothetical protein